MPTWLLTFKFALPAYRIYFASAVDVNAGQAIPTAGSAATRRLHPAIPTEIRFRENSTASESVKADRLVHFQVLTL